jgi:hypothetical protein
MCGIFGFWRRDARRCPRAAGRDGQHAGAPRPRRRRHLAAAGRGVAWATAACPSSTSPAATSRSCPTTARWRWCRTARSSTTSNWRPSCGRRASRCAPLRHRGAAAPVRARRHCVPAAAERHVRHRDRRRARGRDVPRARPHRRQAAVRADDGRQVLFGSEIKALLPVLREGGAAPQVDLEAIHHYLTFNYIPAPWTIWQGIRHVMPGTWMRFTRGGVQTQRWWDLVAAARAGPLLRRLVGGVPGHPGRRHPHPPARRRALGRLPVGRRRLQQHRRPDGAPRRPAGQDLLHRLRRPALRRVRLRGRGGAALRLRAHHARSPN